MPTQCINPECKHCGWESDVQYDAYTDSIVVRVRRFVTDSEGHKYKRGAVFKISEELLCITAEGQEYVCINIPPDRFELILEDTESE